MINRGLMLVITIIGLSLYPVITLSQQSSKLDFPEEQVKAANKGLDLFIESLRNTYGLPFEFTDEDRIKILKKYLSETDRSPYFWEYLHSTFKEEYYTDRCPICWMDAHTRATMIVNYSLSKIMADSWGALILSSEPTGADVFLKISSSLSKEGRTTLKRKYPQGNYAFIVEVSGYKSKEIEVSINKDNTTEERVVLEKR